jgi:hypothetical protein
MLSVQEQLAKRRREHEKKLKCSHLERLKKEIDVSIKSFLSEVFSHFRKYKRINEQISVIQKFMRSFRYIIKMRILKKNHREPDSKTHTAHQIDRFIRIEQNRLEEISRSRDLKNDEWTQLKVILRGFVRTHYPVVNESEFINKMREMLSKEEFNYIQNLMGSQSFIQFFESMKKTQYDMRYGCTPFRKMKIYISGLLWILYYLSSEQLKKSWFPNPESNFEVVFEELRSIVGRKIKEENEHQCEIMERGTPYQPDYCPEPCSLCGSETIQGACFDVDCMRMRENSCSSCGNPIQGNNVVEVDGMRLHQDCANHNQHNTHFRDYTECSICGCSSNDMSFVEEFGLICSDCISANQ